MTDLLRVTVRFFCPYAFQNIWEKLMVPCHGIAGKQPYLNQPPPSVERCIGLIKFSLELYYYCEIILISLTNICISVDSMNLMSKLQQFGKGWPELSLFLFFHFSQDMNWKQWCVFGVVIFFVQFSKIRS